MVLLPAVARDSVVDVVHAPRGRIRARRRTCSSSSRWARSPVLPATALLFLLRDLTQFYFHANHVRHEHGETFTPRFTLTALRLPADELGPEAAARLDAARQADAAVELLVPSNEAARARVDQRLRVYGLGEGADVSDVGRADALFALAASHPRYLLEEVAKVEHGMVRHVLRGPDDRPPLRQGPSRPADHRHGDVRGGGRGGPTGVARCRRPGLARRHPAGLGADRDRGGDGAGPWLESQLRSDGATHTAVSDDPELTHVEVVAIRLALIGLMAAAAAMAAKLGDPALSGRAQGWGAVALAAVRRRHRRRPLALGRPIRPRPAGVPHLTPPLAERLGRGWQGLVVSVPVALVVQNSVALGRRPRPDP